MQISGDMFRTRRPVTRSPKAGGRGESPQQWMNRIAGGLMGVQPWLAENQQPALIPQLPRAVQYQNRSQPPRNPMTPKVSGPLVPQLPREAEWQNRAQSLTDLIGRVSEGRQGLQDAAARQQELRQSMLDQTWSDYAQQAPFMNRGQSPTFGQAAEGLLPGGISPMTASESEYWRRRNSTSGQAPGTSQMQERFTGFNPLSMGAASNEAMLNAEAAGQGVVLQPGGYGSPLSFAPRAMSDQQVQDRLAGLNNAGNVIDQNYRGPFSRQQADGSFAYTDKLTAAKDAAAAAGGNNAVLNQQVMDLEERNAQRMEAQEARRQAWRERHGGMGSREYRRKNMEQDVERRALRRDMLQGLNPMSPQARALYPEMAQRLQPGAQAAAPESPFAQGMPKTLTPPQQAAAVEQSTAKRQSSLVLPVLGLGPDAAYGDIRSAFVKRLTDQGPESWDDASLADVQEIISGEFAGNTQAFEDHKGMFGENQDLKLLNGAFMQLAKSPRTPEARAKWLSKLQFALGTRARQKAQEREIRRRETMPDEFTPWN